VQSGERVEIGELPRLPEPAGALDRRPGSQRERLELADVVVAELVRLRAGEQGQVPERLRLAG
jgi:hypothetical protein